MCMVNSFRGNFQDVHGCIGNVAELVECSPSTKPVSSNHNWTWWCIPAVLALVSWRQKHQKFKVILAYIVPAQSGLHETLPNT